MSLPFVPCAADSAGAFAFLFPETGEVMEFPNDWLAHLDDVERLLWQNANGDYDVIWP